jgi:hypothetical protein
LFVTSNSSIMHSDGQTAQYDQSFETFREMILHSQPSFEIEQDYFDWELAVTGMADMEEEIARLRALSQQL